MRVGAGQALVGERPQRPLLDYAAMLAAFSRPLPAEGAPAPEVIEELVRQANPGLHACTGPRFFGWVIGGSHPAGVAADWLTAAWGQNAANHQAAPAAAAAEAVAGAWLLELLGLPPESSIGFTTGATVANMTCLAAARGEVLRRVGHDVEADGLFGAPPVTVLVGEEAHTTVFAALQMLGLGRRRVRTVETDGQGRILPDRFARALEGVAGPVIAILQAGQINSGDFDPFEALVPLARAAGAWIHVDGAFGLWAAAAPSRRHLCRGVELADSWATDGHKWLQTPYDCGYAIVRDEAAHRRAMTIEASYLPDAAAGERNPSAYVPELSRRARGFATLAMIRHLGRSGIARMIERHCDVAALIAGRLAGKDGIEVANEVVLNQVLVRFGDDALTRAVIAAVQADGICFAGGALWRGRQVMRVSVASWGTDASEAERAVQAILRAWRRVRAGAVPA